MSLAVLTCSVLITPVPESQPKTATTFLGFGGLLDESCSL
jgi:hypothetical protein